MPLSPTDGAGNARDRGTAALRRLADLRISKDLTQLAMASVSRGPGAADGRAGDYDTGKSSPGDRFSSWVLKCIQRVPGYIIPGRGGAAGRPGLVPGRRAAFLVTLPALGG